MAGVYAKKTLQLFKNNVKDAILWPQDPEFDFLVARRKHHLEV